MSGTVVQTSTGFSNSAVSTQTVTMGATPTSGNLLIAMVTFDKDPTVINAPTGFTVAASVRGASTGGAIAYKISDASETTVSFTTTTARQYQMAVREYSGLDTFDVAAFTAYSDTSVTSRSSNTTATTASATALAIALFGSDSRGNTDAGGAFTNSFVDQAIDPGGATGNAGFYVAIRDLTSTGTYETTYSTSGTGDQMVGMIAVFYLAGGGGGVNGNRMPLRMRNPLKGIIG